MQKYNEDNTVVVVQRIIKHYNIKVAGKTVRDTLTSHPEYPTFRSICDSFNDWKINNYPLKYNHDELRELKSPYITHMKAFGGQIAFVEGHENGHVILYDSKNKKKKIGWDDYVKMTSGAIIIIDPEEDSGEKNYSRKYREEYLSKMLLPAIIGVLGFIIFGLLLNNFIFHGNAIPWQQYLLFFTKVAGLLFSTLLLLKEYQLDISIAEKLCNISESVNCNNVLNDKAAIVFGTIGWADVGMIYFTSSLILLLLSGAQVFNGFLLIASSLSLPFAAFSIWYQGYKLKKWCPFCVIVQLILVTEFVLQFLFLQNIRFTFNQFISFSITFFSICILQILTKLYFQELVSSRHYSRTLQSFKRNPEVFRALLLSQKNIDIPVSERSLIFGQRDSDLRITAFFSPNCSHCGTSFRHIYELLQSGINVQVNIVLIGAENRFLDTLYHLLNNGKEDEALEILDQWYKANNIARESFNDEHCLLEAEKVSVEINTDIIKLINTCRITATPAFFINGYSLPLNYQIKDIKYFSKTFAK